jgi:PadR family transcriptional regulator, regulatory protein PadR
MRKTHSLIKVIDALLNDPTEQHWGYELSRQSGIRSGVLYPILRRMLEQGWLEDGWEEAGAASRKRPPRRYYKLTGEGEQRMREILAEAESEPRFAAPLGQGI